MDLNKPVLLFHKPSSDSDTMFSNYLDSVEISTLKLSNLTFYNPGESVPVFAQFGTYITALTLKDISIDTVDAPLNAAGIFDIR